MNEEYNIPDSSKEVIQRRERFNDMVNQAGWSQKPDLLKDIKRAINIMHPNNRNFFLDTYVRKKFKNFLDDKE